MDVERKRLRLNSCIDAIAEVHALLDQIQFDPALLEKFDKLEKTLRSIEVRQVTDQDIDRVEAATNHLLQELKVLYLNNLTPPTHIRPLN